MLPNTFVAGAQKGGTSTLCAALAEHPDVVVASPKEPDFFSRAANLAKPQYYERCFEARGRATPRAIVDGSNAYMTDPQVPLRIRDFLGEDLRFVFSLRSPVDRMISGYWHQAKKHRERRSLEEVFYFESNSPEDAVEEEEARLRQAVARNLVDESAYANRLDDPLLCFRYFRNSLYLTDIGRFLTTFGAGRVKVILFEDLITDPVSVLSSLAAFLKVDPDGFPTKLDLHLNPTRLARAPKLFATLRWLPGRTFLRRIPGCEALKESLLYRSPPPVDPALTQRLRLLAAPEVTRLQDMLDRNLPAIWAARSP